jgi:soluble lytic murein transglycosylase-like protein
MKMALLMRLKQPWKDQNSPMRALRLIATLLLLAGTVFAVEIAELRNGFTIRHRTRETRDRLVRLYLDDQKKSFVDIPAEEVENYSTELDPEPPAAPEAPKPAKTTIQIVSEASEKHGVDSDFIRSVIKQESAGNANAVSRTGARGLMQLMPGTALLLGVKDSFSPEQNVHGGTLYLKELLQRYNGDAIKALAAYNAGPGAVDRYKGVPPYRETRQYVQRVVRDYNKSKQGKDKSTERPKPAVAPSESADTTERAAK